MPPSGAIPFAAVINVGDGMESGNNIHASQSKTDLPAATPRELPAETSPLPTDPGPRPDRSQPGAGHLGRTGPLRSTGCSAIWRRRRDRSTPRLVPRPNWFFAFPLPGAFVLELTEPPRA